MSMFVAILEVLLPVALVIALGYLWVRLRQPFDTATISRLITNIGGPCLVMGTLTNDPPPLDEFWVMASAAMTVIVVSLCLSALVLRLRGLSVQSFVSVLAFSNNGNMGIPICMLALGDAGTIPAVTYFMIMIFLQGLVGIPLVSGTVSLSSLLRTPLFLAGLLTMGMISTGLSFPGWLNTPIRMMGQMSIPMMLLSLGVSLGSLGVGNLMAAARLTVLRLMMGLVVGQAVIALFGLQGVPAAVVTLQSLMPAAVINYLLALRYDRDPQEVASVVVLSTLAAPIVLSIVLSTIL